MSWQQVAKHVLHKLGLKRVHLETGTFIVGASIGRVKKKHNLPGVSQLGKTSG